MKGWSVFSCLLVASAALAHEREPINTEYAPPVEDLIFDWTVSGFDVPDGTLFTLPGFVLEVPVVPRMNIEFAVPILRIEPDGGDSKTNFGDLGMGIRYQLFPESVEGTRPDIDLNFELGIPSGDREAGLGGEAWEAAVGLFVTKHVGRSLWFGNFSYASEIPREPEGERENLFEFAGALVYSWTDRIHPTIELFGESNVTEERTAAFVAPEVIVTLGNGWELKGAVPIGVSEETADIGVQVQLTYLLHLARHREPAHSHR